MAERTIYTQLPTFEKWKYLECRRDADGKCMHEQCPSFVAAEAVDAITKLIENNNDIQAERDNLNKQLKFSDLTARYARKALEDIGWDYRGAESWKEFCKRTNQSMWIEYQSWAEGEGISE